MLPTIQTTEESLLSVQRVMAGHDERVAGRIRLALPGALANHWLIPRLRPLLAKYPELDIEFLTGPDVVNLSRRDADLALRLVRPTQRDLIAKKSGQIELALFGHPSLWGRKKPPARKEDLGQFPFIGLFAEATSELERSLLRKLEPHVRYSIRSATWGSVYYALQAGLGVGILPTFVAEHEPELVRLSVAETVQAPLWMVVHPEIVKCARVRAVMDYLTTLFR